MRLLVTRPEPEGKETAALLRRLGHEALLMPLLRIEPIQQAELGTGPWAAVLFTSANAVRAVATHRRFRELAGLPVYTVGRRTQTAAAAAGFAAVTSADGDVNALVSLVASKPPAAALPSPGVRSRCDTATSPSPPPCGEGSGVGVGEWGSPEPQRHDPPPQPAPSRNRVCAGFGPPIRRSKSAKADFDRGQGVAAARPRPELAPTNIPLLYCAGEDRTGDLAGRLQSQGLQVDTAIVYRATIVAELTPNVRDEFTAGAIDAVLHYSARTAAAFVAAATSAGIRDLSIQARHLCLSAQVAVPLVAAGARSIEVASEASEKALLALIDGT